MRVAPEVEQRRYFTRIADPLKGARAGEAFWIPVQKYRRTMLDRDDDSWWKVDPDLAQLADAYETALHNDGLVDYDTIVFTAEKLLREHEWVRAAIVAKFPVIAIDEYQDLGLALHRIVLRIVESGGRILAVGDPDQSIYGFTGAQPRLLADLSQRPDFQRVVLPFNYRSAGELVEAAEAMLGHRGRYKAKSRDAGLLQAHKCEHGLPHQATEICQTIVPAALARAPERQPGDIAVLYVDKYIGDVIARTADAEGFPYQRLDRGAPYPKTPLTTWLERCATWCVGGWREGDPRLADIIYDWQSFGPPDSALDIRHERALLLVDFLMQSRFDALLHDWLSRFYAACIRDGIDWEGFHADEKTVLDRLLAAARPGGVLEQMSLGRFATRRGAPDRVHLMTLHGSKGLEFDVVIMMGMDQGTLPSYRDETPEEIDEARRKFYVGITRAKREVHFTWSGFTISPRGFRHDRGPSQFLKELSQALKASKAEAE
jgi:DNA helicase-2/ATP-dependent DNA helicase PcrA